MAMLKMQRIYIYALLKYCKDILETLQRRGVVEIENMDLEDSVFYKDDTSAFQAQYQRMASNASEASGILSRYVPRKKGLLSSFKGREQISRSRYDELVDETQDILRVAYDIIACQKKIDANIAEKVKYQSQLEVIKPWLSLDVPMNFSGTATTKAFIGKFSSVKTSTAILSELAELIPEVEGIDVEVIHSDENQTCVFILTSKKDADAVSEALRKIGFEYPSYVSPVVPKAREKEINKHLSNRDGRILENENVIKSYAKYSDKLAFLEDYYVMKAERYAAKASVDTPFDVILIDPPYAFATDGCERLLDDLVSRGLVGEDGVIVLERSKRTTAPAAPRGWYEDDRRDYGETTVYTYRSDAYARTVAQQDDD